VIVLEIDSGLGPRRVDLFSYLDAAREERAHDEEYAWIKALRQMNVDRVPLRTRFTLRGDSLWWFAELYLHKQQRILTVLRALSAFDALVERERPLAVKYAGGGYAGAIAHAAAARKIRYDGPRWPASAFFLSRMETRAASLALAARLSRLRPGRPRPSAVRVAAFVHRAFWRPDSADGGAESYIGPVLRALEARVPAGDIRYIGVGPRTNFRARRWWHPLVATTTGERGGSIVPIERYAAAAALNPSRGIFDERHRMRESLWTSADIRAHAVIKGCDCWPLVKEELAGIALLQFPWSARAMDEAAAALDSTSPDVAVTYAEAGGWGRALALECRRRGVPLAGLQHGFIYRHWLNYRHEPDEMSPDPHNADDAGFPRPSATLLFDAGAARHLAAAGRFPPESLAVTGSARLDDLLATVRSLRPAEIESVKRTVGLVDGRAMVLFAGKEREARRFLPSLVAAVRSMPDVHLVIKPHPAETPGVYAAVVAGVPNARVTDAGASLPALLAAARAVVTVNSTVAIDAMSLGVPSLVIGLPNNLTPFVDAGLMLGAASTEEIRASLSKLLYDQEFRGRLERTPEGRAAERSAEAILALAKIKRKT
jgi:hypothetical protein